MILKAQSRTGLGAGLLEVFYSPGDKTIQLWTYTSGIGWREQQPRVSLALANGDRLGARALADGSVTVYVNGTVRGAWNVAAWPYAASGGYIGIFTLDAPGAVLDDFGGGAVGAGAATALEEQQPADTPAARPKTHSPRSSTCCAIRPTSGCLPSRHRQMAQCKRRAAEAVEPAGDAGQHAAG